MCDYSHGEHGTIGSINGSLEFTRQLKNLDKSMKGSVISCANFRQCTDYPQDVRLAESLRKQAEADTAALEADYEALSRQLEKEEAEVAELEDCNMEYLDELKSSLADQK